VLTRACVRAASLALFVSRFTFHEHLLLGFCGFPTGRQWHYSGMSKPGSFDIHEAFVGSEVNSQPLQRKQTEQLVSHLWKSAIAHSALDLFPLFPFPLFAKNVIAFID